MLKKRSVIMLLLIAFLLATVGTAFMKAPAPIVPVLKLTVTKSPLAVYPPIIIYTAQLNPIPTLSTAALKVDYYNVTSAGKVLLGSATVDRSGKAVFSKQMKKGSYTAIARILLNSQVLWSNQVAYSVP
jgi:hypothetical protein